MSSSNQQQQQQLQFGGSSPSKGPSPSPTPATGKFNNNLIKNMSQKDYNRRKRRGGLIRAEDSCTVPGWTYEDEGEWQGEFFFFQMADTQVGMAESLKPRDPVTGKFLFAPNNELGPNEAQSQQSEESIAREAASKSFEAEIEMVERSVEQINRLNPKFVVLCGDMVDEYPQGLRAGRAPSQQSKNSTSSKPGPSSPKTKAQTAKSGSPRNSSCTSVKVNSPKSQPKQGSSEGSPGQAGQAKGQSQSANQSQQQGSGTVVNNNNNNTTNSPSGQNTSGGAGSVPSPSPEHSPSSSPVRLSDPERRALQIVRCKQALSKINAHIPLVCCCGNHDVGNRANFYSIKQYRESWGHDYFSFWIQGLQCIIINSQYYADKSECEDEYQRQNMWLKDLLKNFNRSHDRRDSQNKSQKLSIEAAASNFSSSNIVNKSITVTTPGSPRSRSGSPKRINSTSISRSPKRSTANISITDKSRLSQSSSPEKKRKLQSNDGQDSTVSSRSPNNISRFDYKMSLYDEDDDFHCYEPHQPTLTASTSAATGATGSSTNTNMTTNSSSSTLGLTNTLSPGPQQQSSSRHGQPALGLTRPRPLIAFSHISPFIESPDEPDAYFNWKKEERYPMLECLLEAGCKNWFCGHYHRNSVGKYKGKNGEEMEVVTTGAIGVNIVTKEGGDPLGISGVGSGLLSDDHCGLRVVKVGNNGDVTHKWKSMGQLTKMKGIEDY